MSSSPTHPISAALASLRSHSRDTQTPARTGLWSRATPSFGPRNILRRLLRFETNAVGRDFVVGDLHGCLDALSRLMEAVNFHPGRDRMFSVGDLVDRGPFSMACLKLVRMPWFHAVRGNHEQHLIEHLQDPHHVRAFDERWLKQQAYSFSERQRFANEWLPALRALPLVIVVGEGEHRFHIVHGELLEEGKSVTNDMIDHWRFADPYKAEKRAMQGRILWSTHQRGGRVRRAHDEALAPVYCGHTVVEAPLRLAGQVFLDRGAYLGQHLKEPRLGPEEGEVPATVRPGLVMVEPLTGEAWMVPTDPIGLAHPVAITTLPSR